METERLKNQEILSSSTATDEEKKAAQAKISSIEDQNMTNMEKFNKIFAGSGKEYELAIGKGEKSPLSGLNEAGSIGEALSGLAGVVKTVSEAFQALAGSMGAGQGSTGASDVPAPEHQ